MKEYKNDGPAIQDSDDSKVWYVIGKPNWLDPPAKEFDSSDEISENTKEFLDKYPHNCPHCGQPAYVGLYSFTCSNNCEDPSD